jgi:hypothetical protein
MFIVYVIGESSEKMLFENKKEAFEYALAVSKELDGVQVNIYKANLIGVAEKTVSISKVRKNTVTRKPKEEDHRANALGIPVPPSPKKKPVLSPQLAEIAQDVLPPDVDDEEEAIPVNARCFLDGNLAVGKKKGPTGESVYLCMDCMGALRG